MFDNKLQVHGRVAKIHTLYSWSSPDSVHQGRPGLSLSALAEGQQKTYTQAPACCAGLTQEDLSASSAR